MAEPKQGGDATAFIQEYGPIADKIGAEIGVDPKIILAKFGLETGWGKSVIPGTYNLGNIKDFSGAGVKAYDKREKSRDAYMKFEDPETFAAYYTDFMKRMYPKAIGAGSDVEAFTSGLNQGVRGSYATAENYPDAIRNAYSLVNARIESMPKEENPFGSGPTEAETIAGEPEPPRVEQSAITDKADAALVGAGTGLVAGKIAQSTNIPSNARYERATERLNSARDKLAEIQSRAARTGNVADLEVEFRRAQGMYDAAERELASATEELKTARAARTAPTTSVAPSAEPGLTPSADQHARGIQGTTKDTGITGRASQTTYNERTAQIARNQRQQQQTMQELARKGIIDPNKAYTLTEGISASTPSGVLAPPGEAAIRQAQLEAELAPHQQRVDQARATRQTAGEAKRTASQSLTQARRGQQSVESAQGAVNVAQKALERTPAGPQGGLQKVGAATAKVAPKALGVISGAATGMSAAEAIDRYKKGDISGAVLSTLEATFGVMSMLPPAHPILLALRGLGTVGGAGLAAYEGYRALKGEPQPEE